MQSNFNFINKVKTTPNNIRSENESSPLDISIVNKLQSSLDKANNNLNIIKTVSALPTKLKDYFEDILKANRIEDFDPTQNFEKIKTTYSKKNLFVDNNFRACDQSVYFSNDYKDYLVYNRATDNRGHIKWIRAKDLHSNAQFAINDSDGNRLSYSLNVNESNYRSYFQTTDLDQGLLGDCWFVSAATGILQNFNLFTRVVPLDNSFNESVYTGAFHFRFWIYGTWKDVVIDDYLPVDCDNKLLFCKNRETRNEFWCALLEKAYAKVFGSYEGLDGGFTEDGLIDMSGGIAETFNLIETRNSFKGQQLWDIIVETRRKRSVIGCHIEVKENTGKRELELSNGLIIGHAYIITKIALFDINRKEYKLIRLYNPWGNSKEWNGDWSDNSSKWKMISNEDKKVLELKIEHDGEFWMSFEDWLKNFEICSICNLTPDTINDISEKDWEDKRSISQIFSMWQCTTHHGKWIKGISAGGCGQYNLAKFWTNPQYPFVINESDLINGDSCWVIINLMQKYTREKRVVLGTNSTEEYIQFRLFKLRNLDTFYNSFRLNKPIFDKDLIRINTSGHYIMKRHVTGRFLLQAGAYVIIPSCYDQDVEGEFMIRIFTEKPLNKDYLGSSNFKVQYDSEEVKGIKKDIQSLSIGAKNIFENFVTIATSDFAKSEVKKEKYNSFNENKTQFVNSFNYPNSNNAREDLGPRISCNQS